MKYPLNLRNLVVGVDLKVPLRNGTWVTGINFDNAASTPPLVPVLQSIINFSPLYSSVHRGMGYKSQLSTSMYEMARHTVAKSVNADLRHHAVIFVKNTTEAINKLANRIGEYNKNAVVLSTDMEHHSNDLPWRGKYKVDYVPVNEEGKLSLEALKSKLRHYRGRVKLVTITGASNVTGYINPIHEAAALAHKYGAKILVDAAQLLPHVPVDMGSLDSPTHIDYLDFSGHKLYCPFGIGVLVGLKSTFDQGAPDYVGGGTIKFVSHDYVRWADPPYKEEAGTPNVIGAVALAESLRTLESIGWRYIQDHEEALVNYTLEKMHKIPDITLYGNSKDSQDRVGVISFNIEGIPHATVAAMLSYEAGIAVRSGCFCAQPYIQKILKIPSKEMKEYIYKDHIYRPGTVRISFGFYNTFEEVDILINTLHNIVRRKKFFLHRYRNMQ